MSSTLTGNYTEVFNIKQEVANDDGFLTIATNTKDIELLEQDLVAINYKEYEEYINQKK